MDTINPDVRKQVFELRAEDLEMRAVWEFALDEEDAEGQDEATVRPRADVSNVDPTETDIGLCIVRALFTAADGSSYVGYCTPSMEFDLGSLQPIVTSSGKQIAFWYGLSEPGTLPAAAYATLGKQPEELFPLSFEAALSTGPLVGGGTINGFSYIKDLSSREIVTVR